MHRKMTRWTQLQFYDRRRDSTFLIVFILAVIVLIALCVFFAQNKGKCDFFKKDIFILLQILVLYYYYLLLVRHAYGKYIFATEIL